MTISYLHSVLNWRPLTLITSFHLILFTVKYTKTDVKLCFTFFSLLFTKKSSLIVVQTNVKHQLHASFHKIGQGFMQSYSSIPINVISYFHCTVCHETIYIHFFSVWYGVHWGSRANKCMQTINKGSTSWKMHEQRTRGINQSK